MTAADKKLADKAKKQGTSFKDRKAATSNFKEKYSKQYTSKYATKPATRPSHIPQSTTVDGKTYNVTYNQQYGGYGYMGPLGTWIMYDMFTDAIMMNMMMRQHGYYHPGMNSGTVVHTGPDAGVVLCIILGGLLLIFIVGIGIKVLMES